MLSLLLSAQGPEQIPDNSQPPIRGFIDDIDHDRISPSQPVNSEGTRKAGGVEWPRCASNLPSHNAVVLRKGRVEVEDKFRFNIAGSVIPTITEKLV